MFNLFKKTQDLIFRGIPVRHFATFEKGIRSTDPKFIHKNNLKPLEIDLETGYGIMRDFDASGKKHQLLVNLDFDHPDYYQIWGSFTSSSKPFNGSFPFLISENLNLNCEKKNQYIHVYDEPLLIKKSAFILHGHIPLDTAAWNSLKVFITHFSG